MDYKALDDFPEILYVVSRIDGRIKFYWENIRKVAALTKPELDQEEIRRIDSCRLLVAAFEEGNKSGKFPVKKSVFIIPSERELSNFLEDLGYDNDPKSRDFKLVRTLTNYLTPDGAIQGK